MYLPQDCVLAAYNPHGCEGRGTRRMRLVLLFDAGKLVGGTSKKISGEIEIPNLSEENEIEEVDVSCRSPSPTPPCGG